MNAQLEPTLLDHATEALRANGLTAQLGRPPKGGRGRADCWMRIGKGNARNDYAVEIKRRVTPATLGAVLAHLRQIGETAGRAPLLITDYVTPPVADRLREQHQQFADAAGNVYVEGPNFLVYVVGRKPVTTEGATRPNTAFTTTGLRVLFALMCDPTLEGRPYRAVAAAAGVALGAVPRIFADLRRAGILIVTQDRRRLFATRRLLDEWALVYARTLRAKNLAGTYVVANFGTWADWPLQPPDQLWGGEPAAHLLVRYLRPGILTIYADKLPPALIVAQRLVRAKPHDQDHLLEVRKPFWGKALNMQTGRTVHPILVYADLLATGDARCIETAQLVYEQELARFFPAT